MATSHTSSQDTKSEKATDIDTQISKPLMSTTSHTSSQDAKSEKATDIDTRFKRLKTSHNLSQETKSEKATDVDTTTHEQATDVDTQSESLGSGVFRDDGSQHSSDKLPSDDDSQASRKTKVWDEEGRFAGKRWTRMCMGLPSDTDDDDDNHTNLTSVAA